MFEQLARDPCSKRYGHPAGEGWMPVLETDTDVRFGDLIQLNMIHDFENAGYPYGWFVTSLTSVPTDNTPNTEFDARPSRIEFETRTQAEEAGNVSTFIFFDFYAVRGEATFPEPRLRQACVTWVGSKSNIALTVCQSWSTSLDLDVWLEIADLQGPNAMTGSRQGLTRVSRSFRARKNMVFDLALEQPDTALQNIADARAITDWPDLVARLNWQQDWVHLQGAVLSCQLVAEELDTGTDRDSAFGYGLSLSGSWKVPGTQRQSSLVDNLGPRQDTVQFQVQTCSGSGCYVFDLSTAETGYDAFYDVTNQTLEPLDQLGALLTITGGTIACFPPSSTAWRK